MNIQFLKRRLYLHALLGVCIFVFISFDQNVHAARKKDKDQEEEAEVNYVVTPPVFKRLSASHELIGESKYQEAGEVLEYVRDSRRLNDHERALIWQTYGYIFSAQEKHKQAIKAFTKCLSFKALPKGSMQDTQFNVGQLYLITKNYKMAVATLVDWLKKVKKPSASAKYLVAMAYVQNKQFNKALPLARQAVDATPKPKEAWLQLLMAIHFEKKNYKEVAKDLKKLINFYPRRNYWMQLSQIYLELKQQKSALVTLELAYLQKYLKKESDLVNLAYLYLNEGLPLKSLNVLDKGIKSGSIKRSIKNLSLFGDSCLRAKEYKRAIVPMINAAKISKDGNLYVRVAHVYVEMENWNGAINTLKLAVKKGKLKDPGNANLLLGIASYNAKKMAIAKKAFRDAMKFKNTKNTARQWYKLASKKQ